MKNYLHIALCGMGILLALSGCQKDPSSANNNDGTIKFTARTSGSRIDTKTAYTGEGTLQDGKLVWERIDWAAGDEVLIWSNTAVVREDGHHPDFGDDAKNIATYTIENPEQASDTESKATLGDDAGTGLAFVDSNPANFWGIYPASAVEKGEGLQPTGSSVTFSISDSQECTLDGKVAAPDMSNAVMLAYLEGAKPLSSGETNSMDFYTAFTTFQFNVKTESDGNLTLKQVTLASADNTTNIAGKVAATIAAGGASTFASISEGSTSITATFDSNPAISSEDDVTFSVLTAPVETGIVATFVIESTVGDITTEIVKSATLKKKNASTGEYETMSFAPGKKYMINGLIVPTNVYFNDFTLQLEVLGWDEVTIDGSADEFPQVTQFSVSGEGVLNGDTDLHIGGPISDDNRQKDPYRQQWYFKTGQTVTIFFKVMLPAGGSWEVKPVNLPEGFTIKNVSPSLDEGTSGEGDGEGDGEETEPVDPSTQLWGPVNVKGSTDVYLEITYTGETEAQFYFHTYVYSGANKTGNKFNVDSETQLYDRGRGYHTFIVNSNLYPTE